MLAHAKLPKKFWAEALSTATYVINRSPSVPLDGDTLQKVWTGKEVSYRHLKVFGCLAYVHGTDETRPSKSKPGNQLKVVRKLFIHKSVYLGKGEFSRKKNRILTHRRVLLYFWPRAVYLQRGEELYR